VLPSLTRYYASDPTTLRLSVSAVVWMGDGAREFLLMRRSDNGHWGLPGGYVEVGESVRDAAAREVREETGHVVSVGKLIGVYSDPESQVVEYGAGDRVQVVNLCFQAASLAEGEMTTPEETLELGVFPCDALPEPFVPIHEIRVRDAMDAVRNNSSEVPVR
jgi:ADP-ribose pyrophosphatase YjhB (NUDIX family)